MKVLVLLLLVVFSFSAVQAQGIRSGQDPATLRDPDLDARQRFTRALRGHAARDVARLRQGRDDPANHENDSDAGAAEPCAHAAMTTRGNHEFLR